MVSGGGDGSARQSARGGRGGEIASCQGNSGAESVPLIIRSGDPPRLRAVLTGLGTALCPWELPLEGDLFGGPVAMRLGVGGSWSTVERTRMG